MAAYLALRDVDPELDEDAPRFGAPVLPVDWTVEPVATTPAPSWVARSPEGLDFLVVRCNAVGARGLYLIRGDRAYLDGLDQSEVAPGAEVYRLALAGPGKARQVMRYWRWWRCDVTEPATALDVAEGRASSEGDPVQRDAVARELAAEGIALPDPSSSPLPWDLDADGNETTVELAARRVRALGRPALCPGGVPWTMAGQSDEAAIESEADRGA